jgi:hypothetical protein
LGTPASFHPATISDIAKTNSRARRLLEQPLETAEMPSSEEEATGGFELLREKTTEEKAQKRD